MNDVLTTIASQLGLGGVGGFLVGYLVKKIAKILAFLAGLAFLGLLYLSNKGIVSVNYQKLTEMVSSMLGSTTQANSMLTHVVANAPFGGSFVLGFALGIKAG